MRRELSSRSTEHSKVAGIYTFHEDMALMSVMANNNVGIIRRLTKEEFTPAFWYYVGID